MEKEINVSKILEHALKGLNLWSIIHGNIIFEENVGDIICYTDRVTDNEKLQFDEYGHWMYGMYNNRCLFSESVVLFPSNDCLTWDNFEPSWELKHFEPFQKVLVALPEKGITTYWEADLFNRQAGNLYVTVTGKYLTKDEILPYEGNENMLGTKKE